MRQPDLKAPLDDFAEGRPGRHGLLAQLAQSDIIDADRCSHLGIMTTERIEAVKHAVWAHMRPSAGIGGAMGRETLGNGAS